MIDPTLDETTTSFPSFELHSIGMNASVTVAVPITFVSKTDLKSSMPEDMTPLTSEPIAALLTRISRRLWSSMTLRRAALMDGAEVMSSSIAVTVDLEDGFEDKSLAAAAWPFVREREVMMIL